MNLVVIYLTPINFTAIKLIVALHGIDLASKGITEIANGFNGIVG
jgi:hypothetical protein